MAKNQDELTEEEPNSDYGHCFVDYRCLTCKSLCQSIGELLNRFKPYKEHCKDLTNRRRCLHIKSCWQTLSHAPSPHSLLLPQARSLVQSKRPPRKAMTISFKASLKNKPSSWSTPSLFTPLYLNWCKSLHTRSSLLLGMNGLELQRTLCFCLASNSLYLVNLNMYWTSTRDHFQNSKQGFAWHNNQRAERRLGWLASQCGKVGRCGNDH